MKSNSIASVDDNTEDYSELNSFDNDDCNDLDENDEDNFENNNSFQKFTPNTNEYKENVNSKRKSKLNIDRKRKCRTTFTKNQLNALECEFLKSNFVSNDKIDSIIQITGLDSRIIKNWFKNKRSRVLADSKASPSKVSPLGKNSISDSLNSNDKDSSFYESNHSNSSILTNDLPTKSKESNVFVNNLKTNNLDFSVNLNVSIIDKIDSNSNQKTNLNGLLNVVQSITLDSMMNMSNIASDKTNLTTKYQKEKKPRRKQTRKDSNKTKKKTDANLNDINNLTCSKCLNISKILCACNISKQALKRLYKNVSDFNNVTIFTEPSIEINFQRTKIKTNFHQNHNDEASSKANYVISYERFVDFENVDPGTEKIFEVL